MDTLYLLIPLSAVLILGIVGVFGWAIHSGQFDDIEQEGTRLLEEAAPSAGEWTSVDARQALLGGTPQE